MAREQSGSAQDERAIFDTIAETYQLAPEAERQAMIAELRHSLPSIPAAERESLLGAVERAVGENLEWQEPEL